MTQRLYYTDCTVLEFDARVADVVQQDGRVAVVLDQSAFYPTSGGQVFDTGYIESGGNRVRVTEVAEAGDGTVLHFVGAADVALASGAAVHGAIDADRRRDHMQQHSGQHVLSAAFERLFDMRTASFHMGDESCSIDLDAKAISEEQLARAEQESNRIVLEDRPVAIRFASVEQARTMGVRKIPPEVREELRLIDIADFDLNACGGTHVTRTGQIGAILLRKSEKVKQGVRVEFVCGERALRTARHDYKTMVEAAALYSAHIWDLPQQIRKSLDEIKTAQKERKKLVEELAEFHAQQMLAETAEQHGLKLIVQVVADRDLPFIKLLAQKLTTAKSIVALLGTTLDQPALVFAQSGGMPFDMGALMKEAMTSLGGRGGGNRELAQGGAPAGTNVGGIIDEIAGKLRAAAT
jgi:alanyl-tRNA synthetase